VSAFTRRPDGVAPAESLNVIVGDVGDENAVSKAVAGHDAVVSVLGVGRPLKHDQVVVDGVGNIVSAMADQGVRRLVYQSFIGVPESRAAVGFVLRRIAPIPLRHEIADHVAKEAVVSASGLDWTIVRPPKLTEGPYTGRYVDGEHISTRKPVPVLSRADTADFILRTLDNPLTVGKVMRLLPGARA
jgi:putative NADH-flavin reductase